MPPETFTAMFVEETETEEITAASSKRKLDDLPPGELLVKVHYSSLNYKDALSANPRPGSDEGTSPYPRNFPCRGASCDQRQPQRPLPPETASSSPAMIWG